MATVKTYGVHVVVTGRFREIFVTPQGEGAGYALTQYGHIDDSGVRKLRSWGWAPDQVAAVEKAIGHTERQFG